jgi:hypothetical protein
MGVRENFLSCLASMYWSTPMVVKNGREQGPIVDSSIGVKQGDPLSPLLFGLFIDRVEAWLKERAPQCGVQLGGELLRVLLYADDLTLLASSPAELQALLDALQAFCTVNSLHVNVAKSVVVVFGKRKPRVGREIPTTGWQFEGVQLPVVPEFRYLGITFHQTRGVSACTEALSAAAMRAMWGVLARCKTLEMPTIQLRMSLLFDSIVTPILVYCSEEWGPTLLRSCSSPKKCLDLALHRPLFLFLRRLGGNLRRSTRRELLLREFGAKPLARAWLRASVQLWNRVAALPDTDPLARAMCENLSLPGRTPQFWSVGFESFLCRIGALPEAGLVAEEGWAVLSVDKVLAAFDEWFAQGFQGLPDDPRQASSSAVSLCTYERWFAVTPVEEGCGTGDWSAVPGYVSHTAGIPARHVRSLAAFRLGAHHLEVATGRWAGRPRPQRVCALCDCGVGDEFHMVFECAAQAVPRQMHAPLFAQFGGWEAASSDRSDLGADALRHFVAQDARLVASFVHACELRASAEPPDEVVFGDPLSETTDEFLECADDDVSDVISFALDAVLDVPGFFPCPP